MHRAFIGKFSQNTIMDTIYSLHKYFQTIYSSSKHGKLANPLNVLSSNVKPFFSPSPFSIRQICKALLATNG